MENSVAEIWKPTFVNPDYLISNQGRIKVKSRLIWNSVNKSYSTRKGRILTPNNNNSKRYWRIAIPSITGNKLSRKHYAIHRLVAEAFLPNPKNLPQVNHIDGNKDNNKVTNLEWCDQSYNITHALANGLISRKNQSANCHLRKLKPEEVSFIKSEFAKLLLLKEVIKCIFVRI